jgi:hypothetical protein
VGREVQRGDVAVRVDDANLDRRSEAAIGLTVKHVPRGVRLRAASLSGNSRALCSGADALRVGREAGRDANAPLLPGERIGLGFGVFPRSFRPNAWQHVGLLLETELGSLRCVAIPITEGGQPLAFRPRQRYTLGLDVSLEGFTSWLGSVSQLVTVPLEAGVWLGRIHPEVGAGIAGAGCPDSRCNAPSKDQRINYANAIPIFAGARVVAFETGSLSLGASLRYRAVHLAADTFVGRESFWMHGPVLSPYIGAVTPVTNGGEMGGAREALIAFEIPLGYAFAENGRQTFSAGMNLALLFTAF